MASLYQPVVVRKRADGTRVKSRCKTWYGRFKDRTGKPVQVSLKTTVKGAAVLKLADLVKQARAGAVDSLDRPIATALEDWQAAMQARNADARHVRLLIFRVRELAKECGWKTIADLEENAAERGLVRLQALGPEKPQKHKRRGISAKTRNDYADALRSFARWLRIDLRALKHISTDTDRRHDRRPLAQTELAHLLTTTANSPDTWAGLDGRSRHALYVVALSTGFRVGELYRMTPRCFELTANPPAAVLPAGWTKNRKPVRQPLPASVVPFLRRFLAGRDRDALLWPGRWHHYAVVILRRDLAAAGIPYRIDGPDGPLYFDAHAFRHQYIAMLDHPSVTLKQAMTLARHSDPKLTLRVYGQKTKLELAAAVDVASSVAPALGMDRPGLALNGPAVSVDHLGRVRPERIGSDGKGPTTPVAGVEAITPSIYDVICVLICVVARLFALDTTPATASRAA